jgi:uncharacterized protein YcnI
MTTSPRQRRPIRRHVLVAAAAVAGVVGLRAGVASAHIDPDPPTVPAGTSVTVGFGVEHGCDGSNTTQLEFQIPAGVADAVAVDKPGWTTSADGDTVTFTGGNLDAATPETFSLTFTAPAVTGTIRFPIIQTCAVGELAWIEQTTPGAAEPEHPAPEMEVVEGPATTAAPETSSPAITSPATVAPDATVPATSPATAAPDTSAAATSAGATTEPVLIAPATVAPATASSDSAGNAGLIIGLAIAAVVVIGGAVLIARRRKNL